MHIVAGIWLKIQRARSKDVERIFIPRVEVEFVQIAFLKVVNGKMQMGACGKTGVSHKSDHITLIDFMGNAGARENRGRLLYTLSFPFSRGKLLSVPCLAVSGRF